MLINTGRKIYTTLSEKIVGTETYTGNTKPNTIGDPDYVEPVIDETSCPVSGTSINIAWSNQQSYTPYTDCDLVIFLNGIQVLEELFNNAGTLVATVGDVVVVQQKATSPWSPNSSARLIVKINGSDVYNNNVVVFDELLNTYTFTLDFDNTYEVISTTTSLYGNVEMNQIFTKNNCTEGLIPSTYNYVVEANTFQASTQIAANNLALADILANGQAMANSEGSCSVPPPEFYSYGQNIVNGRPFVSSYTGDISQIIGISSLDNTQVITDTLPGISPISLNVNSNGRFLITESSGTFRIKIRSNGFVRIGCDKDFTAVFRFNVNVNGANTTLQTLNVSKVILGGYTEETVTYNFTFDLSYALPLGAYVDANVEVYFVTDPNSVVGNIILDATEIEFLIQKTG